MHDRNKQDKCHLGFLVSSDVALNQSGGWYRPSLEAIDSSCHKSPVGEIKGKNMRRNASISSKDISLDEAAGCLYPYALLVLQA